MRNPHCVALTALLVLSACDAPNRPAPTPRLACETTLTLNLSPSDWVILNPQDASCLHLISPGEYALAAFDPFAIRLAETGQEPPKVRRAEFTLTNDAEAPDRVHAPPSRVSGIPERGHLFRDVVDSPPPPFDRTEPWRPGERFEITPVGGGATQTARVEAVAGKLVIAVVEAAETKYSALFIRQVKEAADYLERTGVPAWLSARYGTTHPLTSDGSGQLLILLDTYPPDSGVGASRSWRDSQGTGPVHTWVVLNLAIHSGTESWMRQHEHTSYRLKVLAHELTHAWQMARLGDQGPGVRMQDFSSPTWAMEGGADLIAMEQVRRFLGVGRRANWDWTRHLDAGRGEITLALEPAWTGGDLRAGYMRTSSFLRDLQSRLMDAGMDEDAAFTLLARGSLEGWHGQENPGGDGLVSRVRTHLGPTWDPADAALLWALSQAADDRTNSAVIRNPWYRSATAPGTGTGWRSSVDALIDLDRPFRHTISQEGGGAQYVRLRSQRGGARLSLTSADRRAHWGLIRDR